MVQFKVFKKSAPNGKLTIYLGRRDFVDHVSAVDPRRKVFGQLVCSFRYGREDDEVMGLNFQKDLFLASEQIYPPKDVEPTKLAGATHKEARGNALDGHLKNIAHKCIQHSAQPENRDMFGMVISYTVKAKLYLGAMGGEVTAELPFVLMHPKPDLRRMMRADSQAQVESFRSDSMGASVDMD
ncbi:hypothetical protein C7M84_012505 [Penaeus vannamei]|uniref:Uncharacterized protein n=1 Tax=Penaeus vannamei TaxID=6689 RepID=A0A3R7NX95_PENVA|nr:hypothetical protein C7M84_012505 [Penaeus vannamei]